jgi:hypothetical protein
VFDPPMPPPLPAPIQNTAPTKEVLGPKPAKNVALPPLEQRLDYNEIPHGKQNWYVQTSGLWQPVTLETVPLRYVAWVHVTPHNSGDVIVEAKLAGSPNFRALTATLFDPYGQTVTRLELTADGTMARGQAHVANPMLWDGDHPNLYLVEVSTSGQVVHTRFGFRELTTLDGRLYLNGKPFYMRGARSGFLPNRDLHSAFRRLHPSGDAHLKGHGLEHAALPHQGPGSAQPRSSR